jgi:short-subunit dehydrogenase
MSTMSRTRQVVLTGATGPIGRHVAERLAERGHALALVVKDRAK